MLHALDKEIHPHPGHQDQLDIKIFGPLGADLHAQHTWLSH